MKKIISLFISLILAFAFAGCSNNEEPYSKKSFVQGEEKITEVQIDVRDRKVEVRASEDGRIRIDYFENSKEFYEVSVSAGGVLTMAAASDKELEDYIGKNAPAKARRITLWIPQELLNSLEISTTNENISAEKISLAEKVSLKANGGDIFFESLDAGKEIYLEVKNGNISGTVSGSCDDYAISCSVKKGESSLPESKEDGSKKLFVKANNGDIMIDIK